MPFFLQVHIQEKGFFISSAHSKTLRREDFMFFSETGPVSCGPPSGASDRDPGCRVSPAEKEETAVGNDTPADL